MCGRLFIKPITNILLLLKTLGLRDIALPILNNLAPTESVPVVYMHNNKPVLNYMRWWLHPGWSESAPNQTYTTFNARIETVETMRTFRSSIRHRRGIIPAAGFVEWRQEGNVKQPYYVEAMEGEPLAIAVIWDVWRDELFSCAVLTQPANEAFAAIHDRMPLSLTGKQIKRWLDPKEDASVLLKDLAGSSLPLSAKRVTTSVNNARDKSDIEFLDALSPMQNPLPF